VIEKQSFLISGNAHSAATTELGVGALESIYEAVDD
jgi:hypothetical protein